MPEMRLRPGLCPRPRWGSLQHSPRQPSWIKRPTTKGRGGEAREGGMGGKGWGGGGKGTEGKGREGGLTPTFLYPPPPLHIQTVRFFILKFQIDCPLHQLDFINVLDVVAS